MGFLERLGRRKEGPVERIIRINQKIKFIEVEIDGNNDRERRITDFAGKLAKAEKSEQEEAAKLRDHIQGETKLGARGYEQARRDQAKYSAQAGLFRAHLSAHIKEFGEVSKIAEKSIQLQEEIRTLVQEAEQLAIGLLRNGESLPPHPHIKKYSDLAKLSRAADRPAT